jgi:NAD+-dependent protein deacetylase sirtuin 5
MSKDQSTAEVEDSAIPLLDLPHCHKCGSLLRPGVVWFGESVEHLEEIAELLEKVCDLFLVVGTSSMVCYFLFYFLEIHSLD